MPDDSPSTPDPVTGKMIEIKGAQVTDRRTVGSLGDVLVVTRPDGISPEAWSGCDRVVLRALRPDEDESEEAVARMREDVEALVGVEHPGLLRVLGFARHKNEEFVALECPSGETLQSLVARREPEPARALEIARAVAAALEELARRERPHRDFGTSSVFVGKDGSPRIVPVACPRDFRVEHRVSPKAFYRGAPLYAAPELHEAGGLGPTQRSNIFAFGVAFYEMLTFQAPFRGGTPTRLLLDIEESDPRPPSTVISGLPPELDRICLRCMEKDPERRYPGFAAIESTLRIASESVAFGGRPSSGRSQSTPELPSPEPQSAPSSTRTTRRAAASSRMSGRQKGLLAASAAVVVAALGLVALVLTAGRRPGPPPETVALDVLRQAGELADRKEYEKAWRLLDSHRDRIRDVDPSGFDGLIRSARASDWIQRGEAAREEGRWEDAVRAFENALAGSPTPEDVNLRACLDESLYRAELGRAEVAERLDDWKAAARALEKAISFAGKRGVPESELGPVREDAVFVGVMLEADDARDAGDAAAERERLFRAAELRRGDRAVLERLAALGAGPRPAREALARSRKALEAGERSEAERLAKEAAELWPADERPRQVLTYLADRSYCDSQNAIFVSTTGPWESWGPRERAKAFCIDPYESHAEGERLPRTRVSGLEAAAECRKRGGRLCRAAEWQLACSGPEGRVFPYGNEYVFGACNVAGNGPAGPGVAPDCRSPFGAYDMSGNVAEWTADYVRGKGQVVAGGDWSSGESGSTCRSVIHFGPKLSSPRVGFRCCWSMPDGEEAGPKP